MTVNINDMNTIFTGGYPYTALKMNVTDMGSSNNSLLLFIGVNDETRFAVTKNGEVTINANIVNDSQYVLSVLSNQSDILTVAKSTSIFWRPLWVQTYAEAMEDISYQGSNVVIDLANGMVFRSNTSNISSFNIRMPDTYWSYATCWSYTLILEGPCDIRPDIWWDSGRFNPANTAGPSGGYGYDYYWTGGGPPEHVYGPTIITFQHATGWSAGQNDVWYATVSGKNFLPTNA